MNLSKILGDLSRERENIEETIHSLESLAEIRRGRRGWFPKRSDGPDSGGGSPAEGSGVPAPRLPRRPRRPPKTGRAGASIRLNAKLADAIATRRRCRG